MLRRRKFIKALIITVVVLILTTVAAYSIWRIFSFTGSVEVIENIRTEDSLAFTIDMFPNETKVISRTIQNTGSADTRVDLGLNFTPQNRGVVAQLSATTFTIPAGGAKTFQLTVSASNDAQPGTYQVEIDVFRSAESPSHDNDDDDD